MNHLNSIVRERALFLCAANQLRTQHFKLREFDFLFFHFQNNKFVQFEHLLRPNLEFPYHKCVS